MDWEFLKPILINRLAHYLGMLAATLVTLGLVKSDQSGAFVQIASGIIVGALSLLWSWWRDRGREQLAAHLKKMTGTKTVADANLVAKASPATPPPAVTELAARVAS